MVLPSIWDLLIPNFNLATTYIGLLLILIGIGSLILWFNTGFNVSKFLNWGAILIFIGFLLSWGRSILEDILSTSEGKAYVFSGIFLSVAYYYLIIRKPKKRGRKK